MVAFSVMRNGSEGKKNLREKVRLRWCSTKHFKQTSEWHAGGRTQDE